MRVVAVLILLVFSSASGAFAFPAAMMAVGGATPLPSIIKPPPPGGDPTVGVLPSYNDAYPNWANAGLPLVGGIPNRTTQCGATVTPTGKIPPTSGDDASVINSAIGACTAGDFVQLAAGIFNVAQNEIILLNKGITLRGFGSPSNACATGALTPCWPTVIVQYNGAIAAWTITATTAGANCGVNAASASTCSTSSMILMSPSNNFNWGWSGCNFGSAPTGCGTTLAQDVAQGATTVQVASTANFSVGGWVLIDEDPQVVSTTNPTDHGNANVEASADWLSASGAPATMRLEGGDESSTYSFYPNRVNAELHLVKSIGAGPCPGANCTLTFDDPLTLAFRETGSHNAQVYWPTLQSSNTANPFLSQAGVENMTIQRPGGGGIQMTFCAYCWVKNVEVGGWIEGAINLEYSARDEVTGSYFHDCFDCENNGAEYPIGISSASTEALVDNNIILRGGKGMVGRAANTAVVANNYVDDTMYMLVYSSGDSWDDMDVNGSHYAGTHHFLFEGNWGTNCDNDETHGNAIYHVYFRNYCTGVRSTFTDPSNGLVVNETAGTAYFPGAFLSGSISGNTLTASVSNGALQVGQIISGVGVAIPTTVTGGSGSTWTVTPSQTIGTENMVGNQLTTPGPRRAAGPMGFDYWLGYVGNVLGKLGVSTSGNGWTYICTAFSDKCIWMSGWTASEWNGDPDPNLNGTGSNGTWIFRHGNYDTVNDAIIWDPGTPDHNLPSSFFLTSAPSYFGGSYTWPWVTPENATTQIQSGPTTTACTNNPIVAGPCSGNPAKARWDNGTPFVQP